MSFLAMSCSFLSHTFFFFQMKRKTYFYNASYELVLFIEKSSVGLLKLNEKVGVVPQEVYFDDLKVTHQYSEIVAGSDFYPFGLAIEDRQITREDYRYGYQGKFAEKDEETGWNHFELREYDAVIGRWNSTDPMGQHWSPYKGMGNNPVSSTDPDGGKDDVYYNSRSGKTSVVSTNEADRIFIDGQYRGGGGADGTWKFYAPDATVHSEKNFAFYNSFGGSLNTNMYDRLWNGAKSFDEQTALLQAKVANKDATVLAVTLGIPLAIVGGGELIAAAPAIGEGATFLYGEAKYYGLKGVISGINGVKYGSDILGLFLIRINLNMGSSKLISALIAPNLLSAANKAKIGVDTGQSPPKLIYKIYQQAKTEFKK